MKWFFITLLALSALLLATNPNEADFKEHLRVHIDQLLKDYVADNTGANTGAGSLLDRASNALARLSVNETEQFIERKNYYLFSQYTYELPMLGDDKKMTFIGIFNNFIQTE